LGVGENPIAVCLCHFVRNFGPIKLTTISETVNAAGETRETFRRPNLQPFLDDPDVWLVASIEDCDLESGTAKHGPIFRERVLRPEATPLIETAEDALAVTLHETGAVDLDRVAELVGRSRETAIAELGERIFVDPEVALAHSRDVWVTADAYLSGKIRTKLAAAVAAASLDERYRRNVAALEKTLPGSICCCGIDPTNSLPDGELRGPEAKDSPPRATPIKGSGVPPFSSSGWRPSWENDNATFL
jgi:N12 class adenine-specific DNA methylase